jgi:hypothetical protein
MCDDQGMSLTVWDDSGVMSRNRHGSRFLGFAAAFAMLLWYVLWARPRLLTWGATPDEAGQTYAGDGLVPDPDGGATMATTLRAPPERVWPWLVQMGCDRGGWYSWDWLDNNGEPSAESIARTAYGFAFRSPS